MKAKQIRQEDQELMTEIGLRLKNLRTSKYISSSSMAKQVGLSRNGYHLIESGKVYYNISALLRVANFHDFSLSELFKDY